MKAADLALTPLALAAARALERQHPEVVFTSGRRTLQAQAHAMATNVVAAGKDWIARTYSASAPAVACSAWLAKTAATSVLDITAGLLQVLARFPDSELRHLSLHLSGEAWDVQPVPGPAGEAIKTSIRNLPALEKFLEREGGLTRWHAQFREPAGGGSR